MIRGIPCIFWYGAPNPLSCVYACNMPPSYSFQQIITPLSDRNSAVCPYLQRSVKLTHTGFKKCAHCGTNMIKHTTETPITILPYAIEYIQAWVLQTSLLG